MTKYNLEIIGGTYSAVDVLEALANGEPTIITEGRASKFEDASFHSVENGQILGQLVIDTDKAFTQEDIDSLESQFPGIGFRVAEIR